MSIRKKMSEETQPLFDGDMSNHDLTDNMEKRVNQFLLDIKQKKQESLKQIGDYAAEPPPGFAEWLRAVINKTNKKDKILILRQTLSMAKPLANTSNYHQELLSIIEGLKQDEAAALCKNLTELQQFGKIASTINTYPNNGHSRKAQIRLEYAFKGYVEHIETEYRASLRNNVKSRHSLHSDLKDSLSSLMTIIAQDFNHDINQQSFAVLHSFQDKKAEHTKAIQGAPLLGKAYKNVTNYITEMEQKVSSSEYLAKDNKILDKVKDATYKERAQRMQKRSKR